MDFEKYMEEFHSGIAPLTQEYFRLNHARLNGIEEAKKQYEKGIDQTTSFYQSKRAQLKKQVTHWYGKFMICKAENNNLRRRIVTLNAAIALYNLTIKRRVEVVGENAPGRKHVSELVSQELVSANQT